MPQGQSNVGHTGHTQSLVSSLFFPAPQVAGEQGYKMAISKVQKLLCVCAAAAAAAAHQSLFCKAVNNNQRLPWVGSFSCVSLVCECAVAMSRHPIYGRRRGSDMMI